ncbi:MAG: tetratricopeptide repeat protein [Myxococcota bacterium]
MLNIAATYGVQDKLEESAEYYRRGLEISEAALGPTHPQVGSALKGLGTVQRLRGDTAEAVATLQRSLELLEANGVAPMSLADGQATLAHALWDEGRDLARARELAARARATFVELGAPAASDLAELDAWLAEVEPGAVSPSD